MDLSNDLISKFVKITSNQGNNKTKEGTVYGTIVEFENKMYVKLDGSDLLTPINSTSDVKDSERVTIMIKDHNAVVTGNISSPSASSGDVKKVTQDVGNIGNQINEFEIVVADKISTKELDAQVARIDHLIAGKAEITDLHAANATIGQLNAEIGNINTLINGNLTSDNILSFNINAEKVTVDDAFIQDAMINNISASKINAGIINTNNVNIESEDGSLIINGSTQQFKDVDGNVRIQIGKDSTGDFTFALYGKDGQGQLINQNGIQASAISDGLIVNDMISDGTITGEKVDISSIITEINDDGSTTLNSSKIYLDTEEKTLEVAFSQLKNKVDVIENVTVDGDLSSVVNQVTSNTSKIEINETKINTLISEDSIIKEEISDLENNVTVFNETLNSKYATLNQSLSGFKTEVADTYATKSSVNDVSNDLKTNYSTTSVMNSAIDQKANQISSSVSSTYATKKSINDLESDIQNTYSTKTELNQTSSDLTVKISDAGGYNLLFNGNFSNGINSWVSNGGHVATNLSNDIGRGYRIDGQLNVSKYIYQEVELDPNQTEYTVSCYMHVSSNGSDGTTGSTSLRSLYCEFEYTDGTYRYLIKSVNNFNTWEQVYVTATKPNDKKFKKVRVHGYVRNTSKTVHYANFMLSKGSTPIPWSPNPNEVFAGVTKIDKNGVTVSQSNYSGYTKMSADGFYVNNSKEDVIAITANGSTFNGNFKCYSNNIPGDDYLHMDGALLKGYNTTGGNKPVFAGGLWTDENIGYFSVGYTNALSSDENGCLWMSPQEGNTGCRLSYSKLVDGNVRHTNLYFQKDGAIDFTTTIRGYNDTDDNYTYRFDSGVAVKAFRCNNIRTNNIYPRNSGSCDIGSPTNRYRDIFADSLSTTNSELKLGTIASSGSWGTYGALGINSKTGYVTPLKASGNFSLGTSGLRFHSLYLINSPSVSSDERLKTDIHYLGTPYEPEVIDDRSVVNMDISGSDMHDFIKNDLKLASYRYKLNIERGNTSVDYGFIAQDVLYTKVGSEIVQLENPDDLDSELSVNQGNYINVIAGALQEEIKIRDEQISELNQRITKLEAIIEQLLENYGNV